MPQQQREVRHSCLNNECQLYGQSGKGHIIRYGFFGLKRGKRRRYRYKTCGQTFCTDWHTQIACFNLFHIAEGISLRFLRGVHKMCMKS